MSNLIGLYPMTSGTLDGAPNTFSSNTTDNEAAIVVTGYFTDKSEVINGNDYINIITDEDGTPKLVRGVIVDSGTPTAPILTIDTAADIEDGSITLTKLAAGITPSHVARFAGEHTWTGGAVTSAATVAGVTASDLVYVTVKTKATEASYLVSATAGSGNITFELSAANTSNDAVVTYIVFTEAS